MAVIKHVINVLLQLDFTYLCTCVV